MISFTVPAVPVAQPRQRSAVIAGLIRTYTPAKHPVNAFKASCRLCLRDAYTGQPLAGALKLTAVFVMPRPTARIWKRRDMPRYDHTSRPDLDNLLKSLKDALSGLAWRDDSQVSQVAAWKWVAAGDESPHVEVRIEEVK